MLLMHCNATATIMHSKTADAPAILSKADVVILVVGRVKMVKSSWIKLRAAAVGVGINSVNNPSGKQGHWLMGDIKHTCLITPVPGGVGPMTIAMGRCCFFYSKCAQYYSASSKWK
uniref:methenyltetrahydrofolate cyclohydrolase n=1 Tax=Trieres chinensis TaxID=1514140 RepID=A0A7S1YU39_TRICV|mmetsp:Transcript_10615/g.22248  ORF Transcript_10615/g.22248 Transcript_10615/m.22248 type:complete len:116 (+) Transcript_10615:1033-1380(+)